MNAFLLFVASLALVLIAAPFGVRSAAFDPAPYSGGSKVLHPNYKIYWKVDSTNIYLALDANTTGWFGFALGEPTSGSMPGGDFVTVQYGSDDLPIVKDRWNNKFGLPQEDCSQDWSIINFHTESNGRVVAELKRQLDTGDTQDRPIVAGHTRILFAFGDAKTPEYHGSNRGMDAIEFIPPAAAAVVPLPSDGISQEIRMAAAIPAQVTTYTCRSFALPADKPYHIVSVKAYIDPNTAKYVHHYVAYLCKYEEGNTNNYAYRYFSGAGQCNSPIGSPTSDCSIVFYVWAGGVGELRLPEVAGFPVGPQTNYLVLEVHYNNPDLDIGKVDNSGLDVVYTPTLRQYEAATLVLGDPLVRLGSIPALTAAHHVETTCPSECTNLWPHDINVIGSFLHMHMTGKSMWTSQWRAGSRVGTYTNRVDFYSYHMQQLTPREYVIKKGDILNTHCVFDTSSRSSSTPFGVNTEDEMCMEFLAYYPRLYFPNNVNRTGNMCGYYSDTQSGCGDAAGVVLNVANPVRTDPVADRTVTYGTSKEGCMAGTPSYTGLPPAVKSLMIHTGGASILSGSLSFFVFAIFVFFAFL